MSTLSDICTGAFLSPDPALRAAIVAEAISWLGTPFHHEAGVKGAGVDCGHFLKGVFTNAGLPGPALIPHYPRDFMLHSGREWFIEIVLQFADELQMGDGRLETGEKAVAPRSPLLSPISVLPADIIVFKHGRSYSHGAIVIAWPKIIHADYDARKVIYGDARLDPRPKRYFRHKALVTT